MVVSMRKRKVLLIHKYTVVSEREETIEFSVKMQDYGIFIAANQIPWSQKKFPLEEFRPCV